MQFRFQTTETKALIDLLRGISDLKNEITFICCQNSIKIIEYIDEYFFYIVINDKDLLHKYYECDDKFKFRLKPSIFINKFKKGCDLIEMRISKNKIDIIFFIKNKIYEKYSNLNIEEYTYFDKEPIKFSKILSIDTSYFTSILNQLKSKIKNKNEMLYIKLYSEHVDFSSKYDTIIVTDYLRSIEKEYIKVQLNFKKIYNIVKYNKKLSLFVQIFINPNLIVLKYDGIFKITNMITC
jgi:hypothetical protein